MYESYEARHDGHEENRYSRMDSGPRFWGFTFSGNVRLEDLAQFYGLKMPGLEPGLTLNAWLERDGNGPLKPGHRAVVGGAQLHVLEMTDGAVRKVGLELKPARARRTPHLRRLYRRKSAQNLVHPRAYKVA